MTGRDKDKTGKKEGLLGPSHVPHPEDHWPPGFPKPVEPGPWKDDPGKSKDKNDDPFENDRSGR